MRQIHWWGAATGAAVLATAAFAAPSAFAAHPSTKTAPKPAPRVVQVAHAGDKKFAAKNVVAKNGGDNRGGDNRGGDNRGGDNRGGDNRGGDNRRDDRWGRCHYPPKKAYTVTLRGPSYSRPGKIPLSGTVKVDDCGYGHVIVHVYKKVEDKRHHSVWQALDATGDTADDGSYQVFADLDRGGADFLTVVDGATGSMGAAMSNAISVWTGR